MGCFTDQVKLTHSLVGNLDEAIKEVKLLGELEEESSQKITELEVLCKKLREDTRRLEEEKATIEEMVDSRDELLMEITRETALDHMGEDEDEEEEEKDADDGGDAAAPLLPPHHHLRCSLLLCLRRSMKKALWRRSLLPCLRRSMKKALWRMTLMIWMMTRMKAALTWTSGFLKMEVMIGIESLSQSLKFRSKIKFLGFT
jgi:hypothetical protein